MWCTTSAPGAPAALPSSTLRGSPIPRRRWSVPTVWSWTGDVSEWISLSPRGPTPLRLASTWADPHTMVEGVNETAAAAAAAAVVVEGGGDGTRTTVTMIDAAATTVDTIVDTIVETGDTTDMTSTTSTVAGAPPHPTTVDTGHAPGLAHTAHDDTNCQQDQAIHFFFVNHIGAEPFGSVVELTKVYINRRSSSATSEEVLFMCCRCLYFFTFSMHPFSVCAEDLEGGNETHWARLSIF